MPKPGPLPEYHASIEFVDGLRVLSAMETWCQLSATLSLDDLVVMGDGLVRRMSPPSTMAELRSAVSRHSGRGCRKLRDTLALVRPAPTRRGRRPCACWWCGPASPSRK